MKAYSNVAAFETAEESHQLVPVPAIGIPRDSALTLVFWCRTKHEIVVVVLSGALGA